MNELKHRSVFIGSSSEGLELAQAVKSQFQEMSWVDIWNEGVFLLNRSNLDSLLRAADLYDFAILCLTPDDMVEKRGREYNAPRDNLLFELGLFLGRMGIYRTFIVSDADIQLPSDFNGISVSTLGPPANGDGWSGVPGACLEIRNEMIKTTRKSLISHYPSTALAMGYFENFIQKVRMALLEKKEIRLDGTSMDYKRFELRIVIPEKIADVDRDRNLLATVEKFKPITLKTPYRDFTFYVDLHADLMAPETLILYDFPTTLSTSRKVIELILRRDYIGDDFETMLLERREILNFSDTLNFLSRDFPEVVILEMGQK